MIEIVEERPSMQKFSDEEFLEGYRAGKGDREMAREFGVDKKAIKYRRQKYCLPPNNPPKGQARKTAEEVKEEYEKRKEGTKKSFEEYCSAERRRKLIKEWWERQKSPCKDCGDEVIGARCKSCNAKKMHEDGTIGGDTQ